MPECKIAERPVREYVHDRKVALGLMVRETCMPQSYATDPRRLLYRELGEIAFHVAGCDF